MSDAPDKPIPAAKQPVLDQAGKPLKCAVCERVMHTPIVCDYCHSLSPASEMLDYFQLLGVARQFDLDRDELRRRYLALSRHAHPDFHSAESEEVNELALKLSSSLNDAYRTLAEPVSRGEYLLELLGGKSSAEDKATPDGFLPEVMMLREEIEEARQEDPQALERIRAGLRDRLDGMIAQLGAAFGRFDSALGCEAIRTRELGEIRQQLNAIHYIRRLLSQAGPD